MNFVVDRRENNLVRRAQVDFWPGVFLAAVLIATFVIVVTLVIVVSLSFRDGTPGDANAIWTLKNYPAVFFDPFTYRVLANTLGFSLITLIVSLAIGVPTAWLAERTDLPGKPALFTLMTIGLLVPGFASSMGWLLMLHSRIGMLNVWLTQTFGLTGPVFNIATISGMGWVQGLNLAPLAFIMTAAVFRAMDPSLEESARMSGAKPRTTLWQITLPLAWPGILAAGIYIFMIGFAAFDVPGVIGWSNRIFTFSTYLLLQVSPTDSLPRYGGAAALSVLMIVIASFFAVWYGRMQSRAYRYQVISGKNYRPQLIELGLAKFPAWCLISLYLLLSKLMPLIVLLWGSLIPFFQIPSARAIQSISLDHYRSVPWDLVRESVVNTVILMILTPTVTIALALCFSWIVLRSKIPGRKWFDFVAFIPHAVPNIVFGIGTLLLALYVIESVVPAYGTLWILLVAFVIGSISYATRMTNSGMIQIHRELEESAQVSGASTIGVLRQVVVPLLASTLLNTWLWIALLTFRELTLAVFLTSRDNITLSVAIWSIWTTGDIGQGAALSFVMFCLMIPIITLYWYFSGKNGQRMN